MILTFNNGYPDYVGYKQIFLGNGNGPASYVTGGDPVTLQNNRRFIDILFDGMTLSGTYFVRGQATTIGERTTWKAVWFVTSTGAQVSAATNLSGETVVMGGYCSQW